MVNTFQKISKIIGDKNIFTNIFTIQACVLIMREYFCFIFIGFISKAKNLTDFTNLLSSHHLKMNDNMILNYVQ